MAESDSLFEPPQAVPGDRLGAAVCAPALSDISVSFEFFPPTSDKIAKQLWSAILRLAPLNPEFVSVTSAQVRLGRTRRRKIRGVGLPYNPDAVVGKSGEAVKPVAKT